MQCERVVLERGSFVNVMTRHARHNIESIASADSVLSLTRAMHYWRNIMTRLIVNIDYASSAKIFIEKYAQLDTDRSNAASSCCNVDAIDITSSSDFDCIDVLIIETYKPFHVGAQKPPLFHYRYFNHDSAGGVPSSLNHHIDFAARNINIVPFDVICRPTIFRRRALSPLSIRFDLMSSA